MRNEGVRNAECGMRSAELPIARFCFSTLCFSQVCRFAIPHSAVRPTHLRGSAKIIVQAFDVVFAKIVARLRLDKDQSFVAGGILAAVR